MNKEPEHPMQPVVLDKDGIVRFKKNAIVRFLQEFSAQRGMDMNALAIMEFSQEDREQFAQLIGYSIGGFSELPYCRDKKVREADLAADKLLKKRKIK